MEPNILHDDEWLTVIEKPPGMIVNEAATTGDNLTVQKWHGERNNIYDLRFSNKENEFLSKSGVVHRLDKETSGLMVLAKKENTYNVLKQAFLERNVQKTYTSLVHGVPKENHGIISVPIVRHPKSWGKFTTGDDLSRTAITEWTTADKFTHEEEKLTMMKLNLMTGRTHQIRVHMKYLGFPVVSDLLYLGDRMYKRDKEWCPRLFLHASTLEFVHPETGEKVRFESELPTDLTMAIQKLVHL